MARNEIYSNVSGNEVFDVCIISASLVEVDVGKFGTLSSTIKKTFGLHN